MITSPCIPISKMSSMGLEKGLEKELKKAWRIKKPHSGLCDSVVGDWQRLCCVFPFLKKLSSVIFEIGIAGMISSAAISCEAALAIGDGLWLLAPT